MELEANGENTENVSKILKMGTIILKGMKATWRLWERERGEREREQLREELYNYASF